MDKLGQEILRQGREAVAASRRLRAETRRSIAESKKAWEANPWVVFSFQRERSAKACAALQEAIRAMHRYDSRHSASFTVRKVDEGRIYWEGRVEEFTLIDHPEAESCYAWHYMEHGRRRSFSLLKHPPVDSPQSAVQLYLRARDTSLADLAVSPCE